QPRPRPQPSSAPLPVAALVTTGWAALVSATPVLLVTAAVLLISPAPVDSSTVLRGGLAAWLLAHGVPLVTPAGTIGLAPLALAAGSASQMVRDYHTGVVGQSGLVAVSLVYAPNVAVWAASYLVGPGFVLGVGTKVSAGAVVLGPVPALPILAAVPRSPLPTW